MSWNLTILFFFSSSSIPGQILCILFIISESILWTLVAPCVPLSCACSCSLKSYVETMDRVLVSTFTLPDFDRRRGFFSSAISGGTSSSGELVAGGDGRLVDRFGAGKTGLYFFKNSLTSDIIHDGLTYRNILTKEREWFKTTSTSSWLFVAGKVDYKSTRDDCAATKSPFFTEGLTKRRQAGPELDWSMIKDYLITRQLVLSVE